LPEAVTVKIQYQDEHRKKFGCECVFYIRRASRGERRWMAQHTMGFVTIRTT
jgi:hypothetical protein